MEKINFIFTKNKKEIINKKDINAIKKYNKISFIIDSDKYTYHDLIFVKETKESIITTDFKKEEIEVYLKDLKRYIYIPIIIKSIKNTDNFIKIEYIIETEKDTHNIISLEYKKSS